MGYTNKRKRKKNKGHIHSCIYGFFGIIILCIIIGTKSYSIPYNMLKESLDVYVAENKQPRKESGRIENAADLDEANSPYAVLCDAALGKIIKEKRSQERIYPASLTKIMTAVIIIEKLKDLEQPITISPDIFTDLYSQNASRAGFLPNETVKAKDLLYGVLLPSGAECCIALADFIFGSEASFVEQMNQKAKTLGMKGTHFSNCTGLHEDNHYSTAEDIAVLLHYALKNKVFYQVFTSHRYSTAPTNCHKDGITFYSTMFQYLQDAELENGEILGGKTGYTEQAGLCLASLARIDGKEYILVTAKADGTHETEPFHILDAKKVYNQIGNKTKYKIMQ